MIDTLYNSPIVDLILVFGCIKLLIVGWTLLLLRRC